MHLDLVLLISTSHYFSSTCDCWEGKTHHLRPEASIKFQHPFSPPAERDLPCPGCKRTTGQVALPTTGMLHGPNIRPAISSIRRRFPTCGSPAEPKAGKPGTPRCKGCFSGEIQRACCLCSISEAVRRHWRRIRAAHRGTAR